MFMKKIKSVIMSLTLALTIVLGFMPGVTITAHADDTHTHDDYTAWETTGSLPTEAGSYYLTENVTLSDTWTVPSGTTDLCLNGYTVTGNGNSSVISIGSDSTLNLYDCSSGSSGKITGGKATNGGGVYNAGTFNMYGGDISSNTADTDTSNGHGGGVYNTGTFNMSGGTINSNTATWGVAESIMIAHSTCVQEP